VYATTPSAQNRLQYLAQVQNHDLSSWSPACT
jgi:hypothetical protein